MNKIVPGCKYFLHSHGLRVDIRKGGGLFSKIARQNGILESGTLDRDLRAQF